MQTQVPTPQPANANRMWFIIIGVVVIAIALVSGIELARSNSDIICTRNFQDSGSCTSGSWGPWSASSVSVDRNACTSTYSEARTYTGLRNTISSTISVRANAHSHCDLSDEAFRSGSGEITSQFSACQIQESRTRVVSGTGTGVSCVVPTATSTTPGLGTSGGGGTGGTGGYDPNAGTITSDTISETTGEVDDSKTETVTGSYQLYLDMIDARFATSTLHIAPALLHSGEKTRVIWTSDHVKTCVVTGQNGDAWPKPVTTTETVTDAEGNQIQQEVTSTPPGKTGDELSSPIIQPTTYTLTCTTALGTKLVRQATVNLIPTFQEQ
ncbi:hypothetical protein A2680_00590 [Candidatus Kaiserbacteria bacterium RIFCSPHIGHO2_01_FULL_55_37]|nr:MAG: hypothetical protein A2680_00590 [Candidatus Kaiserbacteria bacterium RIFCSPHIGHO2_01_FULL_55_37]